MEPMLVLSEAATLLYFLCVQAAQSTRLHPARERERI